MTTVPRRRSRIPGRTAFVSAIGPNTLTRNRSSMACIEVSVERAGLRFAGVVDEDVDRTDEVGTGGGGVIVGVVQADVGDTGDRVPHGVGVTGRAVDPMPAGDELAGDFGADAAGRAGDENGLRAHARYGIAARFRRDGRSDA